MAFVPFFSSFPFSLNRRVWWLGKRQWRWDRSQDDNRSYSISYTQWRRHNFCLRGSRESQVGALSWSCLCLWLSNPLFFLVVFWWWLGWLMETGEGGKSPSQRGLLVTPLPKHHTLPWPHLDKQIHPVSFYELTDTDKYIWHLNGELQCYSCCIYTSLCRESWSFYIIAQLL